MKNELDKLIALIESPNFSGSESFAHDKDIESILSEVIGTSLETICCNLFHYTNDADIREKDNYYKEMQNRELVKLIDFLKSGDLDSAKQISFLQSTDN